MLARVPAVLSATWIAALVLGAGPGAAGRSPAPAAAAPPAHCYVHVPFCVRRCFYCDFAVRVVGENATAISRQSERYTDVLLEEIRTTCARGGPEGLWPGGGGGLRTLYFGGGTPSLMRPEDLGRVVDALGAAGFPLADGAEVTLEMDPGTFDAAKLEAFAARGVTRVNLGVQSFSSEVLAAAGRSHTAEDVDAALAALRACGMRNVGIDLISALPHVTPALWDATLSRAAALAGDGLINHVSVYDLTLEPQTAFWRWGLEPGEGHLPDEQEAAEMLATASRRLQRSGFEHYEVSNFALPGCRSRHNMAYWRNRDYLGFGMGATSALAGGRRFARPRTLEDYRLWVKALPAARLADAIASGDDGQAAADAAREDRLLDAAQEGVMLALRTSDGLDMEDFRGAFGAEAEQVVRASLGAWTAQGLVCEERGGRVLRLAAPRGFMMSNDVLSTLFADLDDAKARCFGGGAGGGPPSNSCTF